MVLVFLVARFPWRGFSVVDAEFLERLTKSKIKNQKSKIKNQKSKIKNQKKPTDAAWATASVGKG